MVAEELDLNLDRDGELPLGVQLAWQLRARILAGDVRPAEQLPSARELAEYTGVNVNTVRTVLARLEAEGLVEIVHGRGTFVSREVNGEALAVDIAAEAAAAAMSAGLDPRRVAAALYSAPPVDERRRLRAEIAALERRLADLRLARLGAQKIADPPRVAGARLQTAEELRETRDTLAARLEVLLSDAGQAAPSAERSVEPASDVVGSEEGRTTSTPLPGRPRMRISYGW